MSNPMRVFVANKLKTLCTDFNIVSGIEKSIFNASIRYSSKHGIARNWKNQAFKDVYKQKWTSVWFNLTNPKNPELLDDVVNGKVDPKDLAHMSHVQLWPTGPVAKSVLKHKEKAARLEKNNGKLADDYKGAFECKKCKSWKTTYYQMQTRSADEPMTTFCTCHNCDNRWKF